MSATLNLLMPLPEEVTKHYLLSDPKSIFSIIQGREENYLRIHLKQGYNEIWDVILGIDTIQTHIEDNYRKGLITEEDFLILQNFMESELIPALAWAFPQIYIPQIFKNTQSK